MENWSHKTQNLGWNGNKISLKLNENWMQKGYKIIQKRTQREKKKLRFILRPVLGNPSSPGPERVIAAGNWDQTTNLTNCVFKKPRKIDPYQGVQWDPTNQLFTPKIQSGTPWAPQEAPERLQKVPWTIFDQMWSRCLDMLLGFASFAFDFLLICK